MPQFLITSGGEGQILLESYVDNNSSYAVYRVDDNGIFQVTMRVNESDATSAEPSAIEPGDDNSDERAEGDDNLQITTQDDGSDTISAETSGTEPGADRSDDIS